MNKTDLRYIQCEQLIMDAFIDLLEEKGYRHITIKEISDRAIINRKTFYNHYESIDALFSAIIKKSITSLFEGVFHDDLINTQKDLESRIKRLLHNLSSNERILSILLNDVSSHELTKQLGGGILQNFFAEAARLRLKKKVNKVPNELLFSSLTASFVAFMKWWIKNIDNYSQDDTAEILLELMSRDRI